MSIILFKFINDLHDQYCTGAKKVYGHKALTYFCSFCVMKVIIQVLG
nr:MAG TPA: zinc finger protein [Crassvirales sp.]